MASAPFEQLWSEYRRTRSTESGAEVARRFLHLLTPIARSVRRAMGGRPDLDDLISAGAVGLLESLERFDPARGVRFETYSGWRIVGAMYDDQRHFAWPSHALRLKAQRLRQAEEELRHALGRPVSDAELAHALDMPQPELARIRPHAGHVAPFSLNGLANERDVPAAETVADRRPGPDRKLRAEEARDLLLGALKNLPDNERITLLLIYFEQLKQVEIAGVLKVTPARVSQIHRKALERLVRRLGPRRDELLDAFQHFPS